jgi:hypothetical protein
MAIGGALRAALKAGDFVQAAMQSRRAARALSDMNRRGGLSSAGGDATDFLGSRGFDTRAMTAPGTGNPYMDWTEPMIDPGLPAFADSLGGGYVLEMPRGGRQRFDGVAANMQLGRRSGFGGIQAPYEGVGKYNTRFDAAEDLDRLTRAGFPEDLSLLGDYWQTPRPISGYPTDIDVPRAFGGYGTGGAFPPFAPRGAPATVPFSEIMNARGYIGNQYPNFFPPQPSPLHRWDRIARQWDIPF